MQTYFLRVGSLAEVQIAISLAELARDDRVIVRTSSGLQVGHVIGPCQEPVTDESNALRIMRQSTREDDLLIRRLNQHKRKAMELCRQRLQESGSDSILLDVEQMLDGQSLVMHFLGKVDQVAQSISNEIVEQYESVVRTRDFAKLLDEGCGPDCGSGGACASGSCAGCVGSNCCGSNLG